MAGRIRSRHWCEATGSSSAERVVLLHPCIRVLKRKARHPCQCFSFSWRTFPPTPRAVGASYGPRAWTASGVIEESLWPQVPADVIEEAEQTAQVEPTWIAMQDNGHAMVD